MHLVATLRAWFGDTRKLHCRYDFKLWEVEPSLEGIEWADPEHTMFI
ncbi:hypothetical protein PSYMO_11510 [Pseudomonas amygdali pv. mori str. 301020]|uniref:Uncharacterized protein n=1 Tax=Pseudomonas amygdali pv. mori str. 301020 TaxID=629261 RepID=A0A656G8P8_PSEA0|nr:hypothetical protein PSYMO_11510 [Pseudomonas amygdali pv. mori str. 301020]